MFWLSKDTLLRLKQRKIQVPAVEGYLLKIETIKNPSSLNIQSVEFRRRNEKGIPGSRRKIDLGRSKKKIPVPTVEGHLLKIETIKTPSSLNIQSVQFRSRNEMGIPGYRRKMDLGRSKKKKSRF
uniref:Uncharacterized protein n=1 Tax=Sipha flava TaxID=143950 RepID=A0A2S2R7U5_9HEMI